MNKDKEQVVVQYEKYYTDDIGRKINKLFSFDQQTLSVESLWVNAIDAFYRYTSPVHFTCITGDFRIVVAHDQGNSNFKFTQYFLTGMDGKIISIQPNMLFGLHNLSSDISTYIKVTNNNASFERSSSKIFNWYAKR